MNAEQKVKQLIELADYDFLDIYQWLGNYLQEHIKNNKQMVNMYNSKYPENHPKRKQPKENFELYFNYHVKCIKVLRQENVFLTIYINGTSIDFTIYLNNQQYDNKVIKKLTSEEKQQVKNCIYSSLDIRTEGDTKLIKDFLEKYKNDLVFVLPPKK